MRSQAMLLLLITTLAIAQPHLPMANVQQITTQVTLYAHTDPSATLAGGRVLSLSSNATSQAAADVRNGSDFMLIPPLSASVHILGTMSVYVWLQSKVSVRGMLRVTISEVAQDSSVLEIRSSSVTVQLSTTVYQIMFSLGTVDHALEAGSTLKLSLQYSPERNVPVMLLWDDPSTPTRLVLEVEALPKITASVADTQGKISTIFPENETGLAKLFAKVTVEDPFHGTNVQTVLLSLANSTGFMLIKDAPMNLTSHVELPFRLDYAMIMRIPSGRFNMTTSVRDAANRTFVTGREFTVTRFHTLMVQLVDAQGRALSGLNISVSAQEQLIETLTTDSTGTVTIQVPSSEAVGPLTLELRKGRVTMLSRQIDVKSDSSLKLEAPIHDWDIVIRLESLGLPVSEAKVDLYLGDTLIGSSTSGTNGTARFVALPFGIYNVTVSSVFGSKRFLNVTHSPAGETVLELPVLSGIRENALPVLAGVAVLTVFGAYLATRRRARARGLKHVGELLGGTIPRPAVIAIVGPSGSGKSLLLQNILVDLLELGRRCVYVSNSELPSKIRSQLRKMGLNVQACEDESKLRFVDAYSGAAGAVSSEKHSVSSARDLTALGVQLTSCLDELGGTGDVFFDSLGPSVVSGGSNRVFDFVQYYGARITKQEGTFLFALSTVIDPQLVRRFEETADCVIQSQKSAGPGKVRGRLLVTKARGIEHEREWIGFKITSKGRMEFVHIPSQ